MKHKTTDTTPLRVLYLEDSPEDVEIIRELLAEAGFDLNMDCATGEKDYVSMLRSVRYDVILSEFRLPGFDAFGALRLSSEFCAQVPFICVSGSIGEETAIELIRHGAVDYVLKNRLVRLPLVINRALDDVKEKESRRRAEEALRGSERTYRAIIETTNTGFVILDEEGKVLDANAEYVRLSGHQSLQEIVGRSVLEWTAEEERERNAQEVAKCFEKGFVRDLEISYEWPDGRRMPIEINARAVEERGKRRILTICRDITERKRAEKALRESEERYRTLVTLLPDAIFVNVDNRVTLVNPAFCRLLGAGNPSQLIGKSVLEIIHPVYREKVRERVNTSLAGEVVPLMEEKYIRLDGTLVDVEATAVGIDWQGSKGSQVIVRDITDRKRAEADLRESEERYHAFFDSSMDAILLTSPDGSIQAANPAACKMLGRTEAEICALGRDGLVDTKDPRLETLLTERIRTGKASGELTMFRKDGSPFPVDVSSALFRDNQGEVHTSMIVRDITERKHGEELLRRFTQAIEQSPASVIMTDAAAHIQYVNPKFTEVTGYTPEEVLGSTPRILNSATIPAEEYDKIWATILAGNVWQGELHNRKKNGELFWESASISPGRDENGVITHLVAVKEDITARKLAEEELRQNETRRLELESELIQAQKLEGLGTLASGIAHDFNNLLGIIIGHVSLLLRMNADAPALKKKNLDAILTAATRGADLVKQLLTFARKTEVVIESVRLNDLVSEIVKLLRETFPRTIAVEAHLTEDVPSIEADATQVHQVLLNLCVNARDAMPNGGTLRIATYRESGESLRSKHQKTTADDYVVLSVSDTGFGMDEETQRRIFEPFFSTKEHGKGSGLGLSLVFGIMESHNGFISCQSEVGKGTTFRCCFPVTSEVREPRQVREETPDDIPGGTETILVVEDEELLRELLKEVLEPKGYTVLMAGDGEEGFAIYRKHRREIALVISDLGLPKFGGDELYYMLKKVNRNVRLILSSGYIEPAKKTKILREGVKDFIQKPYDAAEVLQVIHRILHEGE